MTPSLAVANIWEEAEANYIVDMHCWRVGRPAIRCVYKEFDLRKSSLCSIRVLLKAAVLGASCSLMLVMLVFQP